MPNLYIIAGPNGAGKTTASLTLLPEMLECREFVNADEIAKGLSPFNPEGVALEAGRLMLRRIDELMHAGVDFAFETTLASKSYRRTIERAHEKGYEVTLIFIRLSCVEAAIQRVAERVAQGGHNIAPDVIRRRFHAGLINLNNIYKPICDRVIEFDNE